MLKDLIPLHWLPPILVACVLLSPSPARGEEPAPAGLPRVPDGFRVEWAAAPPLVERPMLAAFDDVGRLYVCDSAGVNLRGAELAANPPHVIRRLEDVDGDGVFDKSVVFADRLVFPQGIEWHDGSVFVSSPPSFWKMTDVDGDGVADRREELATGFANTGVADDMHGASLGPDGRIYWCAGRFPHAIRRPDGPVIHGGTAPLILRCRPDGSDLEVVCGAQGNAVGVAFTDAGDFFACGTFLAPDSMGAGLRDALIHCVDGGEYPVRDRAPGEHRRTGDLLPPLTHLGVAAAADLTIYRGAAFGADYAGDLFSCLFNMHKIVRHRLTPDGASYTCRNEDFLVSSDADFHPTDVLEDADGSLLAVNTGGWFRIGCPTSQIAKPDVLGGILRITKIGAKTPADPRGRQIDWNGLANAELVQLLDDERPAVRDRTIATLARRGESSVNDLRTALAAEATPVLGKKNAVWALTRIEASSARDAVRTALGDADPGVRQSAARSAGLWRDAAALDDLSRLVQDDLAPVRREAATALGRIGKKQATNALLIGLRQCQDRFLEHALIFALIQIADPEGVGPVLMHGDPTIRRGALIALDQMDSGGLQAEFVLEFLKTAPPGLRQTALWVIARHPEWGDALAPYFREWLLAPQWTDADRMILETQLTAFAGQPAVQAVMADVLQTIGAARDARLIILEAMAAAPPVRPIPSWSDALRMVLDSPDEGLVRAALATAWSYPADRRPSLSRTDSQIHYPESTGDFAGTGSVERFYARWSGAIVVPADREYVFALASDDGSRLTLDGHVLIDNGGRHGMREMTGTIELSAGAHELLVEYLQFDGAAGCILSWKEGDAMSPIPASVFTHPEASAADGLAPGLSFELHPLAADENDYLEPEHNRFDPALTRIAADASLTFGTRLAALGVLAPRLTSVDAAQYALFAECLAADRPPLQRMRAAELARQLPLDRAQLEATLARVAEADVLTLPGLLAAYEHGGEAPLGEQLLAAVGKAPGVGGLQPAAITDAFERFPGEVQSRSKLLAARLETSDASQRARLAELEGVLSNGDLLHGREVFFGAKALCATCHAVQGNGGKIGPDLSKIAAIRAPRDLLEAVVFPSSSFARGFEPVSVVTHDGQAHQGIVARESADAIFLYNQTRDELRVSRSQIEELAPGQKSIMPDGLDKQLDRRDLADLLAFLQSLK